MAGLGSQLMNAQMLAHFAIGERKLGWYALGSAFEQRVNVVQAKLATRLTVQIDGSEVDGSEPLWDVHVKASERESVSYLYVTKHEEEDEDGGRHRQRPGTGAW